MSIADLQVTSVRQVFNDGAHNAFTDLCRFNGKLFLAFRSCPDGHQVRPSSRIVILSSDDGQAWERVYTFQVHGRDLRDPHFLIFGDRLFVYSGAWLCGPAGSEPDFNEHLGYGAWTDDGVCWQGPQALAGTYHHYIWRAASDGQRAYLCGRRRCDQSPVATGPVPIQSVLLGSDDGLHFEEVGLFAEDDGNETAFLFEDDGSLLALVRSRSNEALLCRARPPYTTWQRQRLNLNVGGPMLVKWQGRYLVGGRQLPFGEDGPRMTLFELVDDQLHPLTQLPSGGDTSYPGFVSTGDRTALLSYYSSHEGSGTSKAPCAIYLAELAVN